MIQDVPALALTVNGEAIALPEGAGIPDLLRTLGMDPDTVRGVAVAVNEEVLPRREWAGYAFRSGDDVEVVTAKQGG